HEARLVSIPGCHDLVGQWAIAGIQVDEVVVFLAVWSEVLVADAVIERQVRLDAIVVHHVPVEDILAQIGLEQTRLDRGAAWQSEQKVREGRATGLSDVVSQHLVTWSRGGVASEGEAAQRIIAA